MRSPPGSGSNRAAIQAGFEPVVLLWSWESFAGLAVLLTLDGPGLTIDEPLDVRPGRTYVEVLRQQGWHFFDRPVVDRVFRDNAEHPPLGAGCWESPRSWASRSRCSGKGPDPTGHYVLAGRLAPALAFAALSAWSRTRPAGDGAARRARRPGLHCWRCPGCSPTPIWRPSIRS